MENIGLEKKLYGFENGVVHTFLAGCVSNSPMSNNLQEYRLTQISHHP